jgi:branched-chain amino acid transport system substrate-binding protein
MVKDELTRRRALQTLGATGTLGLTGISGCVGLGGSGGSGGDGGTLTIGELNPLSGQASVYGQPEHQGLMVGVEDRGEFEVDGSTYSFEVTSTDDQCTNQEGVNIIRRYTQQEGIRFIAGSLCSNVNQAVASIVDQENVLQFIHGSWAQALSYGRDNVFRNSYTGAQTDPAFVELAQSEGWDKVAMIGDEKHPSILDSHERLAEALPEAGIEVEVIWYERGQEDYSTQVQRASSFEPDALEVAGYTGDVYSAISQAIDLGMDVPIVELSNSSEGAIRGAVDDIAKYEGVMPLGAALSPAIAESGHEPGQNFVDKVHDQFGSDVPWHVGGAHYDMVFALSTAMQNAGTVEDIDAIREELLNLTIDEALSDAPIGGPAQLYTPVPEGRLYDDHGQSWFPSLLRQWQDGDLNVIDTVELSSVPAYPESLTE